MITQTSPYALRQRRTLRSWLGSVMRSFDHGCDVAEVESAAPPVPIRIGAGAEFRAVPFKPEVRDQPRGEVVQFPVHGEALLVHLADVLRQHVAGRGPDHNPLWLTISRCPQARLSIDGAAYVDYLSEVSTYHAAIEAGPDTKVILKTTNFDALASFVIQYINDRLLDRASVEAVP